jgi:hypothetical protein
LDFGLIPAEPPCTRAADAHSCRRRRVDPRNSIKFAASSGVSARPGTDFDLVAVAWQYRCGGGP